MASTSSPRGHSPGPNSDHLGAPPSPYFIPLSHICVSCYSSQNINTLLHNQRSICSWFLALRVWHVVLLVLSIELNWSVHAYNKEAFSPQELFCITVTNERCRVRSYNLVLNSYNRTLHQCTRLWRCFDCNHGLFSRSYGRLLHRSRLLHSTAAQGNRNRNI